MTTQFTGFNTFQLRKIDMSNEAFRIIVFLLDESLYKKGVCYATTLQIAEECFFSQSKRSLEITIPGFVSELEKLKLIKSEKARGQPTKYTLLNLNFAKNFTKEKKQQMQFKPLTKQKTTIPNKYQQTADAWVSWRREQGLEPGFPVEEYAMHIESAAFYIPSENKEFWMQKIFERIKSSDWWGNAACATPHCLLQKFDGTLKVLKIYQELQTKKNRTKITQEVIDTSLEDNEDFKRFSEETGF